MTEEQIRQIVRSEINKNYNSGAPIVAPHFHDGVSNLLIDQKTLGFTPIPQNNKKIVFQEGDTPTFGFGSPSILSKATTGHSAQVLDDATLLINPIPIVVGNGVGIQGAFNGGAAPDGTVIAFMTGVNTTSFLYIRFDSQWFGVNLSATPITP